MATTLTSGSRLSRYQVISPLGAGGMGEVYLARDESLERSVALKVLPPQLVKNQERLRRFVQEARAASSLSHPHIVTIYEIGEAAIQDGDATEAVPSGPSLHFIAMELVAGQTIRQKIHEEKADLRTLLRFLAQAAEGLAKAHAAGIVHRDLKPDNIMISKDGYAKVLDFGLAKLTEIQTAPGDANLSPTEAPTAEGVVMGTVGYMSPEQVRAKGVDHRADVFSFGCILYEAATRRRPFVADSDVETMHMILRDEPPPIEHINPQVPSELRRLIRRCLAKNPEQRLQSMKDLAIELNEIADEYDTLSVSSGSGSSTVAQAPPAPAFSWKAATAIAALVGLAGLTIGAWGFLQRRVATPPSEPYLATKLSRLASVDNLTDTALSPDGKYLAMVAEERGRQSLSVRQIATGSDLRLVAPQEAPLAGVAFSPDGNYVYYLSRDVEDTAYNALYQIPTLGGTARKVFFDVDTAVTFSPDARRFAFVRGYPQFNEMALLIASSDGSGERKLASVIFPANLARTTPAWSPDGERIVAVRTTLQKGLRAWLAAFSATDGTEKPIGSKQWRAIDSVAWLPEGTGLVVVASEWGDATSQLWLVAYPSGQARKITNDLNRYVGLSVSGDGKTLATVQVRRTADVWIAPIDDLAAARKVPLGGDAEGVSGIAATPSGEILFGSDRDGTLAAWRVRPDGGGLTKLSPTGRPASPPMVARASGTIFYTSTADDRVPHVWSVDPDGGNSRQLTRGDGEALIGVAPAGDGILIVRAEGPGLWHLPLPNGEPRRISEQQVGGIYSPDGRSLLVPILASETDRLRVRLQVVPVDGGPPRTTFDAPTLFRFDSLHWAPSGNAVTYLTDRDGVSNIWSQPLDEGLPRPVTTFEEGRIFDFDWTVDGRQIVFTRGSVFTDVVLVSDFR